MATIKTQLYHDNFQNYKRYGIPKAQLVIADIPYNLGSNAYASNPMWYIGGDNKNGESKKAASAFFNGDGDFNLNEYFHFCGKLLKKEPKERGKAPCMIVFCAFEQMMPLIEIAKTHGYMHYIPLIFCKNYSAQVLKANMKVVGATEYALVLYRDKLPKFNNVGEDGKGHMVFNWFPWTRDSGKEYPKIHPTQKPVGVLKRLIEIFTDPGDVVIDPCAGSGSTLRAARELGRNSFGFETNTRYWREAVEKMLAEEENPQILMEVRKMKLIDAEKLKECAVTVQEVGVADVYAPRRPFSAVPMKVIDALPAVEVPRWIPVTERLPDDENEHLVIVNGVWKNIHFKGACEMATYSADEGWILSAFPDWDAPVVTYWMPIPDFDMGGENDKA